MKAIYRVALVCLFCSVSLFGQSIERVINKGGKIHIVAGGREQPIPAPVMFAGGIVVNTNGTFKVGGGKERTLEDGQSISADGTLQNANGTVSPVFDHYLIKGNRVYVVKDGAAAAPVTQNVVLPDQSVLSPDAMLRFANGRMQRLIDGYTLRLDGNVIPAQDTITFKAGKVTVFKDGALIPVASSITMNDGTKVLANGTIISFDGKTRKLQDGETITVPGVVLRR